MSTVDMECSAFSPDRLYFANCSNDGKLKIWETATCRIEREFVHLQSPCSVIHWIYASQESIGTLLNSSKRKRSKRKSVQDSEPKRIVAVGSTDGKIILYDITSTSENSLSVNGYTASITAITWSANCGLFTAADDYQIVEWDIQNNGIKCKWKSGKAKITALALLADGKSLVSADRAIKWWDLATKQIIRTFSGHVNKISILSPVTTNNSNYVISASNGDGQLSVWALDEHKNDRNAVATLAINDDAISVTVHVSKELQVMILAITRSGQAYVFKYQPNGHCLKPLKPILTLVVLSDNNHKESIQQIISGKITEDEKLLLAYGSYLNLNFEVIIPDFSEKVQYLVRSKICELKENKEETTHKVKSVVIEDSNIEHLSPGTTVSPLKRNKGNGTNSKLPLKDRLENISLNMDMNLNKKTPIKCTNMTQTLIQCLNSKDKNTLRSVLLTKNENFIKNITAKLPIEAISPLLEELNDMLQDRTYMSQIAVMWLKALTVTHAAYLSNSDSRGSLNAILNSIDKKMKLLPLISRLKGKVSYATDIISQLKEERGKDMDECLLVYQDPDSSDEDNGLEDNDLASESDENWDEMSDQEETIEQNEMGSKSVKSDDNDSICSF